MLCLNGEGAPLWSYCTAKDGRNEMSAPFAHENGQISAVLIGRGIDGLEWLIVSGEGRLAQRRTAPAVETVCAHGGTDMIGMPYDRDGVPHLALIVEHGDGACCVADLDADGRLAQGAWIPEGNGGLCAVRGWQRPPRLGGLRGRRGRRRCWSRPERTTRR